MAEPRDMDPQAQVVRDATAAYLASVAHVDRADHTRLRGLQFDAGLAWVHLPVGRGGLDVAPKYQELVNQALRQAGLLDDKRHVPLFGPVIATHGTPEQQARYLRPMFTSEEFWCQLFSEPNAGSA